MSNKWLPVTALVVGFGMGLGTYYSAEHAERFHAYTPTETCVQRFLKNTTAGQLSEPNLSQAIVSIAYVCMLTNNNIEETERLGAVVFPHR